MEKNELYIGGKNSIMDAINNHYSVIEVYIDDVKKKIPEFVKCTVKKGEFFDQFYALNHQGYIAKIKPISFYPIECIAKDQPERILVLDHIQDVHNFGAILRNANAFGFKHIIFPKDRSAQVTAQTIKTSSGGYIGLKFIQVSNISSALRYLKKNNVWVYVSALESNSISIKKTEFNAPYALVVGNEAKGCSIPVINEADQIVHIDMCGTVQSLNVSVATGILMHEATRNK